MTEESAFKRTYSLVGTVTEDGEICRWVEMKTVGFLAGKDRISIVKLLVPERDLLESEHPLSRLVRGWRQNDDGVVRAAKIDPPQAATIVSANRFFEKEMLIFPGLRQKSRIVEKPKVVEYQRGRLAIAQGRTGKIEETSNVALRGRNQNMASSFEFTVWTDPAVPLGFAVANIRYTTTVNNVLRSSRDDDWIIDDYGTDAKSELPENN